ncbi:MAG: major capsid protein [Pseudomonadales bacterium]
MSTVLLLDADILCYQTTASVETEVDWGDDFWTLHSDLQEAIDRLGADVAYLTDKLSADEVILCFTDGENFRKQIYPQYKTNRKGVRKPLAYSALVAHCKENYETFTRPNLEADDRNILRTAVKASFITDAAAATAAGLNPVNGETFTTNVTLGAAGDELKGDALVRALFKAREEFDKKDVTGEPFVILRPEQYYSLFNTTDTSKLFYMNKDVGGVGSIATASIPMVAGMKVYMSNASRSSVTPGPCAKASSVGWSAAWIRSTTSPPTSPASTGSTKSCTSCP